MPSHTATRYTNPKAKNYMVGSIYHEDYSLRYNSTIEIKASSSDKYFFTDSRPNFVTP